MAVQTEMFYDYDDEQTTDAEVPAMRSRMDTTDSASPEVLSELQATEVGHPEPVEGYRDSKGIARKPRGYYPIGFIYFLETEDGRVKMGFTTHLVARLRTLRSTLNCQVRLIGFFPASTVTESWLHVKFSRYRIHGDLYRATRPILSFAKQIGFPYHYPQSWRDRIEPTDYWLKMKEFKNPPCGEPEDRPLTLEERKRRDAARAAAKKRKAKKAGKKK